jgi:hypothetical protein
VKRPFPFLLAIISIALTGYSQTELPESDDYESFEVEPPVLMPNRQVDSGQTLAETTRSRRDPVELEKQVERAKRAAADAELLFKKGVLSKMEVEMRTLRIVRLQSDLENARLERAKAEFAIAQTRYEMGKIPKDVFNATARTLETARETADAAAAERDRAEIAAAETNLRRQQKLAEEGSARQADVARAKQKLEELKTGKN